MTLITTVWISGHAAGVIHRPDGLYPFAETCYSCEEFLPIDGFRNTCYRCV